MIPPYTHESFAEWVDIHAETFNERKNLFLSGFRPMAGPWSFGDRLMYCWSIPDEEVFAMLVLIGLK